MGTASLLFLSTLALASPASGQGPGPARNLPEPANDAAGVTYGGTVTGVTKNSITLQYADEMPKRFTVSETLAEGGFAKSPRPIPGRQQPYFLFDSYMYRLADVEVGDCVVIKYSKVNGVVSCDHICIQKRPGGRVPPLPEGAVTAVNRPVRSPDAPPRRVITPSMIPYHERMNAYWDLEEKGIPYPEKFGPYRRWPVAPPPREVITQPPTQ